MKSSRGIYLVGVLSAAYSLPTIKYAATTGQLWSGVFALLPLIGAVGLLLRRSWARFPIYAFSVYVVPTWVVYTMWFIAKKGWPYYSTTLESVLGRSEEHTSELQSPCNLVCRLLLEKKKKNKQYLRICCIS